MGVGQIHGGFSKIGTCGRDPAGWQQGALLSLNGETPLCGWRGRPSCSRRPGLVWPVRQVGGEIGQPTRMGRLSPGQGELISALLSRRLDLKLTKINRTREEVG